MTNDLDAGLWQPADLPVREASGEKHTEVPAPAPGAQFFRLRRPSEAASSPSAAAVSSPASSPATQKKVRKRRYTIAPDGTIRRR
jgi:hypothetical protein